MPISVACSCGKRFRAKDELAGRRLKCPTCGSAIQVPSPQPASPPTIEVACACGKQLRAKPELAGKRVKCPACGDPISIPDSQASQPEPATVVTPKEQPSEVAFDPLAAEPSAASEPDDPLGLGNMDLPAATLPNPPQGVQHAMPAHAMSSPSQPRAKKKSNLPLILAASIGGSVLLLITVVVGVVFMLGGGEEQQTATNEIAQQQPAGFEGLAEGSEERLSPQTPSAKVSSSAPPAAAESNLPDNEYTQLCTQLSNAAAKGDAATMANIFDWNEISNRAVASVDADPDLRRGFIQGMVETKENLPKQIIQEMGKDGTYQLVRLRTIDGEERAIMRLEGRSGFNYHELWFHHVGNELRVADVYPYSAGELFSQTLRRTFVAAAASKNKGLLQQLTPSEKDYVAHRDEIRQLGQFARTNPVQALEVYRQLPASLQEEKIILLLRITAAVSVSKEEYLASVEDFRKHHPNDPAVTIVSIGSFDANGDPDEAMAAIDRLDKVVGGDAFLEIQRAGVCLATGDVEGGKRHLRLCTEKNGQIKQAHIMLIALTIRERTFTETLAALKRADQAFKVGDLRNRPLYEPFVNSPQHEEWLAYLNAK